MNTARFARPAVAVASTFLIAACGGGSDGGEAKTDGTAARSAAATRTVVVDMVDHAFKADGLNVRKGETVTFRFTNRGTVAHEAFIGDAQQQLDYSKQVAEIAKSHGGQGAHTTSTTHDDTGEAPHGHEDAGHDDHPKGGVHLDPGKTGDLSYTFSKSGEVEIACYEPGHLEAGMRLTIPVA